MYLGTNGLGRGLAASSSSTSVALAIPARPSRDLSKHLPRIESFQSWIETGNCAGLLQLLAERSRRDVEKTMQSKF